jgi:hypothetical protein
MSRARGIAHLAVTAIGTWLLVEGTAHAEGAAADALRPEAEGYARLWIGVSGTVDLVHLPAATDACKDTAAGHPASSAGYYCTAPDGSDFPSSGQNLHLSIPGDAGQVGSSIVPGDVRLLLAADYALTPNLLGGLRLGYVFNAYPGSAAVADHHALGPKVHAELRAAYVFGRNPLGHEGFAPMVFLGGGVSQFDGHTTTAVTFDNAVGQEPVTAWLTNAPFFFAVGGGARYQFSSRIAFSAAARFNGAIGGGGFLPTLGPEIAVQYGF